MKLSNRARQQLLAHVRRTAAQHLPMFAPRRSGVPRQPRIAVEAQRLAWLARAKALLDITPAPRPTTD
jgi:hypothetical protein